MATRSADPARIMQIGMGFFASKVLLSAVELDLFGVLAEGPTDAETLRQRLGLHPRSALDFFDALVALGLLDRIGDGAFARYANSAEASAFLVPCSPDYLGGILRMANRRLYPFWARLTDGLKSGLPQNEMAEAGGGDPFATLYADPAVTEETVDAMAGVQLADFRCFAERFDFGPYARACDVGGSGAALSIAIAARHNHVRCVSLDLPPVTDLARRRIAQARLADRIEAVAGDFMADPLPPADLILMSNILHDWSTPEKMLIIGKAFDALPPGGALVVIENIIDDARRTSTQGLLMSLNMLIETPAGYNFSHGQFDGWCRKAGFRETRRMELAGDSAALIAQR